MLVDILAYLLIGCFGVMLLVGLGTVGRCLAIWIFRAKISWIGPWEIAIGWFSLVFASVLLPVIFLASGRASSRRSDGVVHFTQDPFVFLFYVIGTSIPAVALVTITVKLIIWFRQTSKPPER